MGTNGHGYRKHSGHGNWDASNEKHQDIVDSFTVGTMLDAEHDDSLNHTAYNNRNYAEVSNCSEHLQHSQYINVSATSVHPSVQLSIQCQIEAILNCSKPIQSLPWIVDSMPIRSRRQGQEWACQGLSLRTPCTLSFPVHTRIIKSETTSHKPAMNDRVNKEMSDSFYLLEVAHMAGGVDKVSSFSKEGVHSSSNNNSFNLSLLTCGTRKHFISWLLIRRHRLPSQNWLQDNIWAESWTIAWIAPQYIISRLAFKKSLSTRVIRSRSSLSC